MPVTILVADDSATMRRIMEMTFAGEDADVITVENGEAAVRKAAEIKPDIIFADASMDGVDGYEVARAIRSHGSLSKTAVVVMASQRRPYDEARGKAAGVDDHIIKPFDTQQVIDRVSDVLSRPRTAAVAPQAQPSVAAVPAAAAAVGKRGPRTATLAFGSSPLIAAQGGQGGAAVATAPQPSAPGQPRTATASLAAAAGTASPGGPSAGKPPGITTGTPERTAAAQAPAGPGPGAATAPSKPMQPPPGGGLPPVAQSPLGPVVRAAPGATGQVATRGAAANHGISGGVSVKAPSGADTGAATPPAATPPAARPTESSEAAAEKPVARDAVATATAGDSDLARKLAELSLSEAQVQAVLALSRDVVERVVWEVVPDLAETIIREEIKRLTQ